MIKDIADEAFKKLIKHSQSFFNNSFSGSLVARYNRYVTAFETLHDQSVFGLFSTLVTLVLIIAVLFSIEPILGVIFLFWAVIYFIMTIALLKIKIPLDLKHSKTKSNTTAHVADIITNILNVKIFSRSDFETEVLQDRTKDQKKWRDRSWIFSQWMHLLQSGFIALLQFGALLITLMMWNEGTITFGTVVIAQVYSVKIFANMWSLGRNMRRILTAGADANEMIETLELPQDIVDGENLEESQIYDGEVTFRDVSFGYPNAENIFSNFNLSITSGERVAFVGHSGAGKTTITKLLMRFIDVGSGEILIDGQNIQSISQKQLRQSIAYVPQEPMLFHRSIRDNICYGKADATEEEMIEVAKKANAHAFINSLPKGYDTLVGERGVKLSGGERQRVAIARAMLKDAPILMLDEATSALDSITEGQIQEAFERASRDRTTIVIAHRLSTIVSMDRIIVLEKGEVAEQGTHEELLQKGGIYSELWNSQSHGFIGE